MTFLEIDKKKIMAQTEWGWGGICQCSLWGSKVECKCLSLSNPTRFIFITEKSVQGPQCCFFPPNCQGVICRNKKWNWIPTLRPSACCEAIVVETCKVGASKEWMWTWRPVTTNTHLMVVLSCRELFGLRPLWCPPSMNNDFSWRLLWLRPSTFRATFAL